MGPVLGEGIADVRRLRNRAACPAPTRAGEFRVVEVHRPIDHGNEDLSRVAALRVKAGRVSAGRIDAGKNRAGKGVGLDAASPVGARFWGEPRRSVAP